MKNIKNIAIVIAIALAGATTVMQAHAATQGSKPAITEARRFAVDMWQEGWNIRFVNHTSGIRVVRYMVYLANGDQMEREITLLPFRPGIDAIGPLLNGYQIEFIA